MGSCRGEHPQTLLLLYRVPEIWCGAAGVWALSLPTPARGWEGGGWEVGMGCGGVGCCSPMAADLELWENHSPGPREQNQN